MNILASYNWMKEYVKTNASPEDFARRITVAGMGVERLNRLGEQLEGVIVATIVELRQHPNADRLRLVIVDAGKELIEVVCGGSNLSVGMKVAFAPIGTKVRWHGEGELVTLAPAEIRGVKSFGMICASTEIGLGDWFPSGEKEIMDVSHLKVKNGTGLREALHLHDVIFDTEVTTNRPDALSIVGLAREASAILGVPFLWKEPKMVKGKKTKGLPLSVVVKDAALCPRYQAVVMQNVTVSESPWWMKQRLLSAGVRPISNIVDITNYVMLETGQPMHVFDYDKLHGNGIVVRKAIAGEKILALDGKDYELTTNTLIIADKQKPIAIAGIIGGEESSATAETKRIVFESATFDSVSVRRSGRHLNISTDASMRFEKGLSTQGTSGALARAVQLAEELVGATLASSPIDTMRGAYKPKKYSFDPAKAAELIGVDVATKEMVRILTALGFRLLKTGKKYSVIVPWWRDHDIEDSRDLTEEIARIVGYHTLPSVLPPGVPPLRVVSAELRLEDSLKTLLSGIGGTELYTNSFVPEDMLSWVSIPDVFPIRLANPLSADFSVMRTSLIPSVLAAVRDNQVERPENMYFEVSRVYLGHEDHSLPEEPLHMIVACVGNSETGEQYYRAKGVFAHLQDALHLKCSMQKPESLDTKVWHPGRSVEIVCVDGCGMIGEIHPELLAKIGIDRRVALVLIPVSAMVSAIQQTGYVAPPVFPVVKRDIALLVDVKKTFDEIATTLRASSLLLTSVSLFDLYQGKGVPAGKKSMAFHLVFSAVDRTLSTEEVDTAFAALVKKAESTLGAEVRK